MGARYDLSPRVEKGRATVLAVDDDPDTLEVFRGILEGEGYQVATASSGAAGLERLSGGDISLVLLDVRMPEIDGLEVCRRIRATPSYARVPVIFLTADSMDKKGELQGLEAGADDYLRKPVRAELLALRVRNLIRLADAERDRALLAQLAHNEKLATIGQLASGAAHEINNPLAFVLANLGTLKSYLEDTRAVLGAYRQGTAEGRKAEEELGFAATLQDLQPLLEETITGAERMRRIVEQLRTFSSDGEELQAVDLAEVAASILILLERPISRRATLEKKLSPALISQAPAGAVRELVLNLVMNALQATPEGNPERSRLRVCTACRDGRQAVLVVSDTGCGIAPEHLPRIFDPFFTTKPVGQGTGMGLSVCANLVQKLGGTIEVESKLGVGTVFTVSLPLEPPALAQSRG